MPTFQYAAAQNLAGVEFWARQNCTDNDQLKVTAVVIPYARLEEQKHQGKVTGYKIAWYYGDKQKTRKEFYSLEMLDKAKARLWIYS